MIDPVFESAMVDVIEHEGGFQCQPTDSGNWTGGKCGVGQLLGTNMGISAAQYPNLNIKDLTVEKAKAIYHTDYWLKYRINQLPGLLIPSKVLDTAVLAGPNTAIRLLQKALNALGCVLVVDGSIGPATVQGCRSVSVGALLIKYGELLVEHYEEIANSHPDERKFLAGWERRARAAP